MESRFLFQIPDWRCKLSITYFWGFRDFYGSKMLKKKYILKHRYTIVHNEHIHYSQSSFRVQWRKINKVQHSAYKIKFRKAFIQLWFFVFFFRLLFIYIHFVGSNTQLRDSESESEHLQHDRKNRSQISCSIHFLENSNQNITRK